MIDLPTNKFSRAVVRRSDDDALRNNYDIGFFAIGYERRSRFIASKTRSTTDILVGLKYAEKAHFAFARNLSWAEKVKAVTVPLSDYTTDESGDFLRAFRSAVEPLSTIDHPLRAFVDVSSMDRSLMARLLQTISTDLPGPFTLTLFYAPAKFTKPDFAFIPVRECAPAIPELSGPLGHARAELTLLMGVGYEYGVSLGLLQRFEPEMSFAFLPQGKDDRYAPAVREANFDFDFGADNVALIPYDLDQPLGLFETLYSLSIDVSSVKRVIIVPNGPKIFAAIAIIVGLARAPAITVLRVSSSGVTPTHDVEADGSTVALDLICD